MLLVEAQKQKLKRNCVSFSDILNAAVPRIADGGALDSGPQGQLIIT